MTKNISIVRRHYRFDGGAERAVSTFLDLYRDIGFRVTLLCESWSGKCPDDVEVVELDADGSRTTGMNSFRTEVQAYSLQHPSHMIQSHEWIPGSEIVRLGDGLHSEWLSRLSEVRGGIWRAFSRLSRFHRQRLSDERSTLNHPRLRAVIVNSEFIADQVSSRYPGVEDKIVLIRNVVPQSFFDFNPPNAHTEACRSDRYRLLFVGSGWERKGLVTAIEVLARLEERYSLTIIGKDKAEQKYKALAKRLGVDRRIRFLAPKPMTESIYRSFHGLLLPTLYDPFPNVVCEALVSGLRVYCSRECGAIDFKKCEGVNICDLPSDYVRAILSEGPSPDIDYFCGVFGSGQAELAVRKIL